MKNIEQSKFHIWIITNEPDVYLLWCAQRTQLCALLSVISAFSLSLPFKSLVIFKFQLKFHLFHDTFIPAMNYK